MLKGAIIGFGEVAEKAHLPAWTRETGAAIAAVADKSSERRQAAARCMPGVRVYEDLRALFDAEEDLDFVDIASPPHLHAEQIQASLDAGVHVLAEKPLTLSVAEHESIRAKAAGCSRVVFPVHNWKHAPLLAKLRQLLEKKTLGPVHHLEWHTLRTKPATVAPQGQARKNWRTDRRLSGGGILMDHGWHALYLVMWLLGKTPTAANGFLRYPKGADAEQDASCLLRFSDAVALIHLTWNAYRRGHWGILYGEKGRLEIQDDRLIVTLGDTPPQTYVFPEPLSRGSAHPEWFQGTLSAFQAALNDPSGAGAAELEEAGRCISLIETIYRRHEKGASQRRAEVPAAKG